MTGGRSGKVLVGHAQHRQECMAGRHKDYTRCRRGKTGHSEEVCWFKIRQCLKCGRREHGGDSVQCFWYSQLEEGSIRNALLFYKNVMKIIIFNNI